MTTCPCCSNQLLRHIRKNQVSWFCRSCWQEMPELNSRNLNSLSMGRSTQFTIKQLVVSHSL
ncbi:hypothetical protein F7734_29720 [Scytonema sp. UIC 10036]|nr:hypothetical protein [Scytonema sp. UIC 10036]